MKIRHYERNDSEEMELIANTTCEELHQKWEEQGIIPDPTDEEEKPVEPNYNLKIEMIPMIIDSGDGTDDDDDDEDDGLILQLEEIK